jgi:hypothetical protein
MSVDYHHCLPTRIETLLPHGLRQILDASDDVLDVINQSEGEASRAESVALAGVVKHQSLYYHEECCELSRTQSEEPGYRALIWTLVRALSRVSSCNGLLRPSISEGPWDASLKPPRTLDNNLAAINLLWSCTPPNGFVLKAPETFTSASTSFDSNAVRVQHDTNTHNYTMPPPSSEISESSAATYSDWSRTISTPKPDITVGLARNELSRRYDIVLEQWTKRKILVSDPYASQGHTRFPFLIIENKGLVSSSNLFGAQNQAAGAGACAIQMLETLAKQDPAHETRAPRIVFSVTTEGPIHELWVHYRGSDPSRDDVPTLHMSCIGAWRTTLPRHALEFVAAMAIIFRWGAQTFKTQITDVLDRVLAAACASPVPAACASPVMLPVQD